MTAKVASRRNPTLAGLRGADQLLRPHLRGRQEDRPEGRLQRALLHRPLLARRLSTLVPRRHDRKARNHDTTAFIASIGCAALLRVSAALRAPPICGRSTTPRCTPSSSWTAGRLGRRRRRRRLAHDRRRQALGAAADRHAGRSAGRPLPQPVHRLGRRPRGVAPRRRQRRRRPVHRRRRLAVDAPCRRRRCRA